MSKLQVTAVKALKELKYLHSYQINYKDKKGDDRIWEFISRQGLQRLKAEVEEGKSFCDGATIFAFDEAKEKAVLIKEFRVCQNRYLYCLPAGLSDEGETIEQTAIREFKEETGLDFKPLKVEKPRYTSVGLSNEKIAYVYGYFSGKPSNQFNEASEDIETVIADKEMVIKILEKDEVPLRTALALQHFFHLNEFFDL